jgi:hypothetical protein
VLADAIPHHSLEAIEMINFKTYSIPMLMFALADCHESLEIGNYSTEHPYGRKLWAEIDAIRDELLTRRDTTSKKRKLA